MTCIWFTTQIARLVEWLVPGRPLDEEAAIVRTRFLQKDLLSLPSLAFDQVPMGVMHKGETVNSLPGPCRRSHGFSCLIDCLSGRLM